MRYIKKYNVAALCLFLLFGAMTTVLFCASGKEVELEEVKAKKVPKDEKIPPIITMITEVEEVKGVQKYIYVKIKSDNIWYKEGLFGFIYNDIEKKELVGKFKVIKIHAAFTQGEIVELHYPIKPKAIVVIELDPRYYIK